MATTCAVKRCERECGARVIEASAHLVPQATHQGQGLDDGVRAHVVVVLDALEDTPSFVGLVLDDHAGTVSALTHHFDGSEPVALSRVEQLL